MPFLSPDIFQNLKPVFLRHHNIQDHRVVFRDSQVIDGLLPVKTGVHTVFLIFQSFFQQ